MSMRKSSLPGSNSFAASAVRSQGPTVMPQWRRGRGDRSRAAGFVIPDVHQQQPEPGGVHGGWVTGVGGLAGEQVVGLGEDAQKPSSSSAAMAAATSAFVGGSCGQSAGGLSVPSGSRL